MIVTCPNCATQFHLDAQNYKAGQKARCSVCSFMFILPVADLDDDDSPIGYGAPNKAQASAGGLPNELNRFDSLDDRDGGKLSSHATEDSAGFDSYAPPAAPKKKKGGWLKRLVLFLAILLCLGGIGTGVSLIYFPGQISLPFTLPFKLPFDIPGVSTVTDPVAERIADIDKVRDLLLINVSHEYIQNAKLGPMVVITGKVRNNFTTPKEMIRVEATLLDKKGKVLTTQQQYCGVVVPKLQLQVYGQKELAEALDNRYEVYANNINIMPGGEVPFMVLFIYPPSTMAEYTIVVSDVKDPPEIVPPLKAAQPAAPAAAQQ